jgi:hypothetical protein
MWIHVRFVLAALVVVAGLSLAPKDASAFCGFYVSGGDAKLFNNATLVVLMREGTRTILSMQNNYQGPPSDFAMIVPVPVVLQKQNVKTLPREVFDAVDTMGAPRLVEYWEQDPCPPPSTTRDDARPAPVMEALASAPGMMSEESARAPRPPPPKIEAKFSVGEYDILILSAQDALGLDIWLRENKYKIPENAEPLFRPYVQMGMKFFVAKINASKITMENGQAMLSPLRFHYDSDAFFLPIRLGLVNSGGTQDLIVNILALNQRYEVANYNNVAIPTNLEVGEETREKFGTFYAALFDRTVQSIPRAVVTEYSWQAQGCDPCPAPPLGVDTLMSLGADVLPTQRIAKAKGEDDDADDEVDRNGGGSGGAPDLTGMTITRLHLRYGKDALGDDLFFKTAPPISGGRGMPGQLQKGAQPSGSNDFQGRYIIKHPWTGPIACESPRRGMWGGPPGGSPYANNQPAVKPALKLAFVARSGVDLDTTVKEPIPEGTKLSMGGPTPVVKIPPGGGTRARGCAGCNVPGDGAMAGGGAAVLLAILAAARRWRRDRG